MAVYLVRSSKYYPAIQKKVERGVDAFKKFKLKIFS